MPPVWPRAATIGLVWLRADEHMGVAAGLGYFAGGPWPRGILNHHQSPSAAVYHLQLSHRLPRFSTHRPPSPVAFYLALTHRPPSPVAFYLALTLQTAVIDEGRAPPDPA
eukprot:365329-Chlamydomonas_euryale.AAC.8